MKTPLSWRNAWHNKVRSLVALCGIMFAILLIFMELGFYGAARTNAIAVYDMLDFDVAVVSPECMYLGQLGDFPRHRFEEIRSIDGVESLSPLWLQVGRWRNSDTREDWDMLAIAVEPSEQPFRDSALNGRLPEVAMHDRALSDAVSRSEYGILTAGVGSELVHHRIRIVGQFAMGAGFVAGSAIITSRQTFLDVFQFLEKRTGVLAQGEADWNHVPDRRARRRRGRNGCSLSGARGRSANPASRIFNPEGSWIP